MKHLREVTNPKEFNPHKHVTFDTNLHAGHEDEVGRVSKATGVSADKLRTMVANLHKTTINWDEMKEKKAPDRREKQQGGNEKYIKRPKKK